MATLGYVVMDVILPLFILFSLALALTILVTYGVLSCLSPWDHDE